MILLFDNVKADLDRYVAYGTNSRMAAYISFQGAWATLEYRYNHWVHTKVRIPVIRQLMKLYGWFWHKWVEITTGIDIPEQTEVGKGLYIGHFGGIFITGGAKIGENCNLSQGVTIGFGGRGENAGYPVIGDRVYIAAGAKIIGKVRVGNDVAIGANAVVTKDIPDNGVAVGVPAQVINLNGSSDFIKYLGKEEQPHTEQIDV